MGLEEMMRYGNLGVVVISLLLIAVSGIVFSFTYFFFDTINTALETNDCVIEGNGIVSTCQELWELSIYPFLELKEILIWLNFFFIFVLVLAMLLLGYQTGFRPIMLGVLVVFEMLVTYGSLYIGNIYRVFVSNAVLRDIFTPFTVYNKIMLNFPWFVFIVSLFSVVLGIVNWQRVRSNTPQSDLDY